MRPATLIDKSQSYEIADAVRRYPATRGLPLDEDTIQAIAADVGLSYPVRVEPVSRRAMRALIGHGRFLGGYFQPESTHRRVHSIRILEGITDPALLTVVLYHEMTHAKQHEEQRLEPGRGVAPPKSALRLGRGQWRENVVEYEAWTRSARKANRRLGWNLTVAGWLRYMREEMAR